MLSFVLCSLYLLALGLFKTLASVRRFMCALMLGGVFCSVMIFARYILTTFFEKATFRFSELETLLFLKAELPTVAVLAMLCPLAVGYFNSVRSGARLLFAPTIFLLFLAAIFCGTSAPVWIALLIALGVQSLMTYRYAPVLYTMLGMVIVSILNVIPQKLLNRFFAYFGFGTPSQPFTESVSALEGVMLAGLFCSFIWSVIRFAAISTRPEAYPRVLGSASAMIAFFSLWLGGVVMDERAILLLVALLSVPRVSLICSKREEIRLPY